jgi:hypothetical protein
MIEITYRFEPEHLKIYPKLVSNRVEAKSIEAGEPWWHWMLYTIVAGALIVGAQLLFPELTGRPFAWIEFLSGIAVCIGQMWWRYNRLSPASVRPDGPTLAEHRMRVAGDGLNVGSSLMTVTYRWTAFEEATVHDRVIVEPGGGVLVPRRAFAAPGAEATFLEAVRGHIAAGKVQSPAQ